jgi:hypothetical protein
MSSTSRLRRSFFVVFGVSAALAASLVDCKPSAGGSCTKNADGCDTPTSRYACMTGHYVLEACKGPGGCKETPTGTTCDFTRGDVGDPCASANQYVCSADGKSRLRCDGGKLAFVARCSKDGCSIDDSGNAHCTDPYAKPGDACKQLENQTERAAGACNEDFKSELRCKDGKMTLTHQCRGEQGCTPLTSGPWCDRSTALMGDECDPDKPEFAQSCEPSKDKMLTCKGGKLAQSVRCGGEGKCYVRTYGQDGFSHYQAECDQSLALVGEDCLKEGGFACAADLKSRLVCQAGKFALDKPCKSKRGCEVHAADGSPFGCEDK